MVTKRLYTSGLLGLLSLCMAPTRILANEGLAAKPSAILRLKLTPAQTILIITGITATYVACSEKTRTVMTKATLNSIITALRLLLKLPLTIAMKQSIQAKIEHLETIYTTRAGNKITGDDIKAMLKEFKEMIDAIKAGKDVYGWLVA